MPKTYLKIFGWLLFATLIYFPIFQDIDRLPVQLWDESRNANNAFEMSKNGNILIRYYNNEPDMWELNPPLLTWLQSSSLLVFGYNEFGLRFPISLAVIATILLMLHFFKTEFDTYWPGIISALVLVSSEGYMDIHIARTGDHDAVLVLFLTAAAVNFYKYIKYIDLRSKYLLQTTLFLILAVYTKSVAGLFALPGFFIYALLKKQLKSIFTDYRTYLSFLGFILVVGFYYALREFLNPGYLNLVWNDQLFPRFTNTSKSTDYAHQDFFLYFSNLYFIRYKAWRFALLLSLILVAFSSNKKFKDVVLFFFLICFSLLFILSTGTKHIWYDAAVYPLFAMICGIGFYLFFTFLYKYIKLNHSLRLAIIISLALIIFYQPYKKVMEKVYKPKEENTYLYYGTFMNHLKRNSPEIKNYNIFYHWYNAPVEFYSKVLNAEFGYKTNCMGTYVEILNVGDTVLTCDWEYNYMMHEKVEAETIEWFEHCQLLVIRSIK